MALVFDLAGNQVLIDVNQKNVHDKSKLMVLIESLKIKTTLYISTIELFSGKSVETSMLND